MNKALLPYVYQEELYSFSHPVVVVLPRLWADHSAEEQELVNKIVSSTKSKQAITLVELASDEKLENLHRWNPEKVLAFGDSWGADIPPYEVVQREGFTAIRADDVSKLDDQKKKMLWVGIRQMFGV